jgi:ribosomal protein S18 acetylase RimI-like enzyme
MNESTASERLAGGKGRHSQGSARFRMVFLDESHLRDLICLQQTIAASLPSPEIFRLHDEAYFRSLFTVDRSVIGIMDDGKLIGYSIIYLPMDEDRNLGSDINLAGSELKKVAHLQAVAVHPSCRGSGLQSRMIRTHLNVLEDMEYEHVCSTVSPQNPVSLRNMISQGFVIRGLRLKFGGWCRYIIHKSLARPPAFFTQEIRVSGKDLKSQKELLNRGLVGIRTDLNGEGFDLFFAEEKKILD